MNELKNLLLAVVNTGDEANPEKLIWIMVIVGIILVVMAVVSVVVSKKKNNEIESGTDEKENK